MISFFRKHYSVLYLLAILSLFLYSFTQVDLGLTLTQASFWQVIQRSFQSIGYFQRPLSAVLYIGIISVLTLFYWYFLAFAKEGKLEASKLWKIILATSLLLTFSYNAFSHDLFNYVFDAKIVTYYMENPYIHKALDYPSDPMLGFMHWTHRTYPYGPVWLALTIPLSFLGSGYFLPTLVLFKLFIGMSFIGSVSMIYKILQKVDPKHAIFGTVFFALNPLVVIESLVSAHLDIVMLFFALFALYTLIQKKYLVSFSLLLISVGIKFATIFLIPVFLYVFYMQWKRKTIPLNALFLAIAASMLPTVVIASIRTNFQPWYLVSFLSFLPFVNSYMFIVPFVSLSFIMLLYYVPYLYMGNWDPPIPAILSVISTIGFAIVVFTFLRMVWSKYLVSSK